MIAQGSRAWAEAIFGKCELGDSRRVKRAINVAAGLAERAGESLNGAFDSEKETEGAYRFVRNPDIDSDALLKGGIAATFQKLTQAKVVLAVEDTTSLSYAHSVTAYLGDTGGKQNSNQRCFWVHSVLLVDGESGETLGLGGQKYWTREEPAKRGKAKERKNRAYEDKESIRWQETSELLAPQVGEDMSKIVSVADREADIYEYLHYKRTKQERFVVRVTQDRSLVSESLEPNSKPEHVWTRVLSAKVCGHEVVEIAQRGGEFTRKKRKANLSLRYGQLTIKSPLNAPKKQSELTLNFVHAKEEAAPEGVTPLEWLLYTSEPVENELDVLKILAWYRLRWRIEEFHKAWKSGCGIEAMRMQCADSLKRIAVVLAFVAIRLLQLRELSEESPEVSVEEWLEEDAWKCLWIKTEDKPIPEQIPTIKWAYYALGKLGSWRKNRTGRIGWDTLLRGWQRFELYYQGWKSAMSVSRTAF